LVKYEVDGRKVLITIDRPHAMNALSDAVFDELAAAFKEYNENDLILVAILTGAGGRAFSAGADLKEISVRLEAEGGGRRNPMRPGMPMQPGFSAVENSIKPVVAAIDGYCLAGGLELALNCDIRVATAGSVFGLPEPRRSLLAGPGLVHLSRMIPMGEALRMQLTGSPITAERAYQIGLISDVVADREALFVCANTIADEIIECAPLAVQAIKNVVRRARDLPVDAQLRYAETLRNVVRDTEDMKEGPKAFAEKRKPVWKMR